jgi:tetratricopeptide (TPR) repeat protein
MNPLQKKNNKDSMEEGSKSNPYYGITMLSKFDMNLRPMQGKYMRCIKCGAVRLVTDNIEPVIDGNLLLGYNLRCCNCGESMFTLNFNRTRTAGKYNIKEEEIINHMTFGEFYSGLGNVEKALSFYEQALTKGQAALGENNPIMGRVYIGIGELYIFEGDNENAINFLEKAYNIFKGQSENFTAALCNTIGVAYLRRGKYGPALKFLINSIEIELDSSGVNSPLGSLSYENLIEIFNNLGDTKMTKEFTKKSQEIMRNKYSEKKVKEDLKLLEKISNQI